MKTLRVLPFDRAVSRVPAAEVRALRDRLGLRVGEFADLLGATPPSVFAWERDGIVKGPARRLVRLIAENPARWAVSIVETDAGSSARSGRPLAKSRISREEIVERFNRGMTYLAIAREAGLTRERVRQILGSRGLRRTVAERGEMIRKKLDREELAKLAATNWSSGTIAKALGVAISIVDRELDRHGISLAPRPTLSSVYGDRVVALRDRGMKQVEIAADLGISQSDVSRILIARGKRSEGTHDRACAVVPPKTVARIVALRRTGKSQSEIGEIVGLNQSTVSKSLRRAGIS